MKNWIDNARIYHILVDRFSGNKQLKNENKFLGGTLNGITERLDYIQELGYNALWLSPICTSRNYHGYHITDFEQVDPHFGTLDDLKRLIEIVHSHGMHIVTDFVPNHCDFTHPFFTEAKSHPGSRYRNWFYFNANGTYKSFLNFDELPKLNLDFHEARDYMTDVAKYWCGLGFDGLRIDHIIGPSFAFWRYWMKEMKQAFPKKVFFGEAWGIGIDTTLMATTHLKNIWHKQHHGISQEELQRDYVGELDGILDFRYRDILLSHIAKGERILDNRQLEKEVRHHFARYPRGFKLFLFLDNHDTNRILFECKGDRTLVDEAIFFSQQQGKPFILYYGTEAGMTHKESIFSGKLFADLAVRECLF
ncbi:MAG: alpha-amylase family glycosyl hydrolase [Paludibacteraceae bacterium]|nr:alpha-amylase family glycosyl hydrolase [Paludibacteraceae bacterium]